MYFVSFICLTIAFIPVVQLAKPTIKLTFTPDEKYISRDQQIEIQCEVLNPNERTESPQLWYIDINTGKRTPISRSLLTTPMDDAPEVFKNNKNKRYEYLRKNHIRIRRLQMEDSGKYECNCPDCEDAIAKQIRDLNVMKLVVPKWIIEPGGPIHENTKITIKCVTDEFYPYVGHKILRNHLEITNDGKSSLSNSQTFPQRFIWEATITPTADWHNTTLRCMVAEGNTEQQAVKTLEVLFLPRFLRCDEQQLVDMKQAQSTMECSYSGNPAPTLTWRRQTDQRAITSDVGVTIETKDEHHGKYKSTFKLDRTKLMTISSSTTKTNTSGENYHQQLLNGGFIVQLTLNGNERETRAINIVRHANQIRSNPSDSSMSSISLSSLLVAFLFIIHILRH